MSSFQEVLRELGALQTKLVECHEREVAALRAENMGLRAQLSSGVLAAKHDAPLGEQVDGGFHFASAAVVDFENTGTCVPSEAEAEVGVRFVSEAQVEYLSTGTGLTNVAEGVHFNDAKGVHFYEPETESLSLDQGRRFMFRCREDWKPGDDIVRKSRRSDWNPSFCSSSTSLRRTAVRFMTDSCRGNPGVITDRSHFCLLHPQSNFCLFWDLANVLFVIYEITITPLQVLVSSALRLPVMENATLAFWTLDLLLHFFRAIYIGGEITWKRRQIAITYIRTWFLFDVLVLCPDYAALISGSETMSALGFLRGMRLFRLLRLLRFLKMERVIHSIQARINSSTCIHAFGIMRLVVFICVLNHLLACVWYQIGISSDDGWAKNSRSEWDAVYGYFCSLHWSFTQFHGSMEVNPSSLRERIFAVVVVLLALIVFSQFLSSLTDMMIQLQRLRHDKTRQHHALRTFLADHDISSQLSVSAKKYIESEVDMVRKQAAELEVLHTLPPNILMDLYNEARGPLLATHELFRNVRADYPRAMRMLCFEAISERPIHVGETVFSSGDPCSSMFFIEQGALIYTMDPLFAQKITGSHSSPVRRTSSKCSARRWKLRKSEWLCEIALWVVWSNVGEMSAHRNSLLLEIDAVRLARVLKNFEKAYLNVSAYAEEFVATANRCELATDLELVVSEDDQVSRSLSKDTMSSLPFQWTGTPMRVDQSESAESLSLPPAAGARARRHSFSFPFQRPAEEIAASPKASSESTLSGGPQATGKARRHSFSLPFQHLCQEASPGESAGRAPSSVKATTGRPRRQGSACSPQQPCLEPSASLRESGASTVSGTTPATGRAQAKSSQQPGADTETSPDVSELPMSSPPRSGTSCRL